MLNQVGQRRFGAGVKQQKRLRGLVVVQRGPDAVVLQKAVVRREAQLGQLIDIGGVIRLLERGDAQEAALRLVQPRAQLAAAQRRQLG